MISAYKPIEEIGLRTEQRHYVEFLDSGRSPRCQPNPVYPEGCHVDLSGGSKSCVVALPYPAPRCGAMVVRCRTCGASAAATVAGRQDDPRSMAIACKHA